MSLFRTALPFRKPDPLLAHIRRTKIEGVTWSTCLECGSLNILSNKICGRCGANLPRLLDTQGKVRQMPIASPARTRVGSRIVSWVGIALMLAFGLASIYRACARSAPQALD